MFHKLALIALLGAFSTAVASSAEPAGGVNEFRDVCLGGYGSRDELLALAEAKGWQFVKKGEVDAEFDYIFEERMHGRYRWVRGKTGSYKDLVLVVAEDITASEIGDIMRTKCIVFSRSTDQSRARSEIEHFVGHEPANGESALFQWAYVMTAEGRKFFSQDQYGWLRDAVRPAPVNTIHVDRFESFTRMTFEVFILADPDS